MKNGLRSVGLLLLQLAALGGAIEQRIVRQLGALEWDVDVD